MYGMHVHKWSSDLAYVRILYFALSSLLTSEF